MNSASLPRDQPSSTAYDVVIVGGAIIGSSVAWFLSHDDDFDGSVLVVERDPTYETASTTRTNSCMRQQFSNPLNIEISQFAADYVRNFREHVGSDPDVPDLAVNHFGYLYLAGDESFADTLRDNQRVQADLGAGTRMLGPDQITAAFPFVNVDDIVAASFNDVDEGYFDSGTMFACWRRLARRNGVEFSGNEVVDVERGADCVAAVTLASGDRIQCGTLVNAAGPRAAKVARMAGLDLPVEPRKRFTFMFDAAEPLDGDLPLVIDPSGVHVRTEGTSYMAGCTPDIDPAVEPDDFAMDVDIWEQKVWPTLAHRIPAFERIKVTTRWAGHYAHNSFDHNVIVGAHPEVANFLFANGFSGHGLQQAPAVGRGVAELITHGSYQTLDLTPLGYERIARDQPFVETAII